MSDDDVPEQGPKFSKRARLTTPKSRAFADALKVAQHRIEDTLNPAPRDWGWDNIERNPHEDQ